MSFRRWKQITGLTLLAAVLAQGCAAPGRSLQYLLENGSAANHYRNYASSLEYASATEGHTTDASLFQAPRSITTLEDVEQRPIGLNECIRLALSNAAIVRDDQSFLSPGNPVLANPQRVASIFDNAIQDTGFLIGNRGTEAALSDFDPVLTSNLQAGRTEDVQNTANIGLSQGDVLAENSAQWQTRLEKNFAHSGTFAVENNWSYNRNNQSRLFDSAYLGFVQAEYRQPLLAAAGTEFTRIAGPSAQNLRGVSGVSQGVMISRINADISLLDFEQSVTGLIRDVENRYWDLYLYLHLYHSEVMTFRDIVKYSDLLAARAEAQDVVYQAQNRLYEADARIKGSLADVLQAENRLRRLLGLPLNDGQFLKPSDHPSEAQLIPAWDNTLSDALMHRPELRKQKFEIKSLELQLRAARNLNRPRLDLVSQYRVNGFGDTISSSSNDDDNVTVAGYKNALETLTQGNLTGWGAGVQFSMPLGLRISRAQVRNYELRLRKARKVLQVQEEEIARELNNAILEMDRWYLLAEANAKRADVAVEYASTAEERVANDDSRDPTSIGRVLEAKITSRDADQNYLRSIVEYNKAVTELNFRKGGLLAANAVYLAEGEWNPEAYRQADERGEAINRALDNEFLEAVPEPVIEGPADSAWESLNAPGRPAGTPGSVPATGDSPTPPDDATSSVEHATKLPAPAAGSAPTKQQNPGQNLQQPTQPVPAVPGQPQAPGRAPQAAVPGPGSGPQLPSLPPLDQKSREAAGPVKSISLPTDQVNSVSPAAGLPAGMQPTAKPAAVIPSGYLPVLPALRGASGPAPAPATVPATGPAPASSVHPVAPGTIPVMRPAAAAVKVPGPAGPAPVASGVKPAAFTADQSQNAVRPAGWKPAPLVGPSGKPASAEIELPPWLQMPSDAPKTVAPAVPSAGGAAAPASGAAGPTGAISAPAATSNAAQRAARPASSGGWTASKKGSSKP